jgi:lipopolysaccharide transport system permease protein
MSGARVRIRPARGWVPVDWASLWEFRELLWALAARDVKLRYRQTVLGAIWVVLQPLLGAGVFAFVFGTVAKLDSGETPYFLFSYSGLLLWNAFSGGVLRASGAMLQNVGLVSKIFVPRMLLPVSTILSVLLDFAVAFAVLVGLLSLRGVGFGLPVLTAPLWLGAAMLLALGFGLFFGALVVRFRDVSHILPVAIQFGLYASPVAYATSAVPEAVRPIFLLNPMAPLLDGFRWAVCGGAPPAAWAAGYAAACALLVFAAGAIYFARVEREFADVI